MSNVRKNKKLEFIDGLRFFAIFGVVFFHLNPDLFKAGFLGVDIFFIISGFLITKTYFEKKYNLNQFITARLRRIIPMLFFTLIIIILFTFFNYTKNDLIFTINSIISSLLFVSNFYFWNFVNYFNDLNEHVPTLHTWSVSVEMQLYLMSPLIFFLIKKKFLAKNTLLILIMLLIITHYFSLNHNSFNFFSSTNRLVEFGSGILSYFLRKNYQIKSNINNKRYELVLDVLSIFFLIILISCFFIFDQSKNFPSLWSLIIIIATIFILIFSNKNFISFKILSSKFFTSLGKISYSIYLLHFPFLVFAKYNNYYTKILVLFGTCLISFLTYSFIERLFLNKKIISNKLFYKIFFLTFCILISILIIIKNNSYFHNFKLNNLNLMQKKILLEADRAYNSFSEKNMIANEQCHIWTKSVNKNFEEKFIECSIKFSKNKAILIIGDSHAMNLYNSFAIHLKNYFVVGISQGGCRFFTKMKNCKFDELKKFLLKHDKSINIIFVTSSGGDYLNGNKINKERILFDFLFLKDLNLNKKIYWLGPNIDTGISLKDPRIFEFIENGTMNSRINKNILYLDNYLESFVANKLNYISKIKLINYDLKTDFFHNEKFTFARESHWSRYGENYYGKKILNSQVIFNLLK